MSEMLLTGRKILIKKEENNRFIKMVIHAIFRVDTYSNLPLSNCPLSPGNGQLNKLHVNKVHFDLRVQNENAQCLSNTLYFGWDVF